MEIQDRPASCSVFFSNVEVRAGGQSMNTGV